MPEARPVPLGRVCALDLMKEAIMAAMTDAQEAEFKIFCHKDGLSPSGTDLEMWKAARPFGLLPAIWAVHHHEVPEGQRLFDLQALDRYAQQLLPLEDGDPLAGAYLTPAEVASQLQVSPQRVRQLAAENRLPHVDTPLGRFFDPLGVDRYLEATEGDGRNWLRTV